MFSQSATNVARCARALQALLADLENLPAKIDVIMALEREGDELTRTILHRLNSTSVTPFDREDIHALAEELDDVVDDMWAVADLLNVMHLDNVLPELKEQADVLVQMADATVSLMSKLERMNGVRADLDTIDRLESEGDAIYRRALGHLFSGEFTALEVLKFHRHRRLHPRPVAAASSACSSSFRRSSGWPSPWSSRSSSCGRSAASDESTC